MNLNDRCFRSAFRRRASLHLETMSWGVKIRVSRLRGMVGAEKEARTQAKKSLRMTGNVFSAVSARGIIWLGFCKQLGVVESVIFKN